MAVQMNGYVGGLFKGCNKIESIVGCEEAGHIFNADTVCSHCSQFFCLGGVVVQSIDFSAHSRFCHGVTDAALEMFPGFFYTFDDSFKIAVII